MVPEFPEKFNYKLNGWFCLTCEIFDKAIGRERFFRKHDFEEAKPKKKKSSPASKAKAKSSGVVAAPSEDESGI